MHLDVGDRMRWMRGLGVVTWLRTGRCSRNGPGEEVLRPAASQLHATPTVKLGMDVTPT